MFKKSKGRKKTALFILSFILMIIGVLIVIPALFYMLFNLSRSTEILNTWTIFMVTGMVLLLLSAILDYLDLKIIKKQQH